MLAPLVACVFCTTNTNFWKISHECNYFQFSVNVKFPRTRLSNSSSSGESRKVSDSRWVEIVEVVWEIKFQHSLDNPLRRWPRSCSVTLSSSQSRWGLWRKLVRCSLCLCKAKKAAETIAIEASKTKVIKGKYVGKDTLGDMDNVRNVVDDFKTAIKSFGDSNDAESSGNVQDATENRNCQVKSSQVPEPCDGHREQLKSDKEERKKEEKTNITNNNLESKKHNSSEQSLKFPQDYPNAFHHQASRYELLPNIDMYTIASQTQDFIGGLLGSYLLNGTTP